MDGVLTLPCPQRFPVTLSGTPAAGTWATSQMPTGVGYRAMALGMTTPLAKVRGPSGRGSPGPGGASLQPSLCLSCRLFHAPGPHRPPCPWPWRLLPHRAPGPSDPQGVPQLLVLPVWTPDW